MADTLFLPTFYQNRNYNRNWQNRLFFAENRFAIHLNRKTPKLKVAETVAEINFHWHFNGKQSIFWLPNYLFYNRKVLSGFLIYNRKTEISSYFGPGRTLLFTVGPRNHVWVKRPELDFSPPLKSESYFRLVFWEKLQTINQNFLENLRERSIRHQRPNTFYLIWMMKHRFHLEWPRWKFIYFLKISSNYEIFEYERLQNGSCRTCFMLSQG